MHSFDPAVLRRLASHYRERAQSEPEKAMLFTEIASDMEAYVRRAEADSERDEERSGS